MVLEFISEMIFCTPIFFQFHIGAVVVALTAHIVYVEANIRQHFNQYIIDALAGF